MSATAARWEDSYATIEDIEDFLRFFWSWGNLATRLLCVAVGILVALYGTLAPGLTREDRNAIRAISCVPLLTGAALLCWVVCVRVRLQCCLQQMRAEAAAAALELDDQSPAEHTSTPELYRS